MTSMREYREHAEESAGGESAAIVRKAQAALANGSGLPRRRFHLAALSRDQVNGS